LWAEIPSDEKRTKNAAESYHAHLNEQFYSPIKKTKNWHYIDNQVTVHTLICLFHQTAAYYTVSSETDASPDIAEAWGRKIQSVGLSNEYKNAESQLGKWLK
jgi:uncharacterized protein (DUF427 family)